ncbi:MAG: ABC transporter ATP-binding protein [Oscillospiraceae bacterium]|jgi:simple sugar transport system ATP-binding protein|nr:ABC transporter ATP-binding protein [Oscillospiraceae bacterium]
MTAVDFSHISMRFPGVLANDDVSFSVNKGEVFALVGENGAGKSTLMHILYGLLTPTGGEVAVFGKKVTRFTPAAAIARGVGMVHQHFMLVPSFTVAQNIVLSREPRRHHFFYDFKAAEQTTKALSEEYGLAVDARAKVGELGLGLQQRVEILKTLHRGAEILILDEPTAVLTPQETEELFAVIRRLVREKGLTVILITHKLYEVMALSDRVGVMRAGKLVGVSETSAVDEQTLAAMMVGSERAPGGLPERLPPQGDADPVIAVEALEAADDRGLAAVRGLSLTVRRGEILGIAGVEGNGQSELAEAITGLRPIQGGEVRVLGRRINGMSPGRIRALGLSHIPEDRLRTGAAAKASVAENLLAGRQRERAFTGALWRLKRGALRRHAQALFDRFDMRGAGVEVAAGSLSGGNLQKLVVAREFSFESPALVIAQPTRGVDIGAMAFIHQAILDKRNAGCGILLISADLDEIFKLSDRIITIYEGRITGSFDPANTDKAQIGFAMTGGRA